MFDYNPSWLPAAGLSALLSFGGACSVFAQEFVASDGASDDRFATSISISNGIIISGAGFADDNGLKSGSAYVFRETGSPGTRTQSVKLLASDGVLDDRFGHAVSISGDSALVGAPHKDRNANLTAGGAYLFRNLLTASGISTEVVQLEAANFSGTNNERLGSTVALSGNVGLIGAPGRGNSSGVTYVFTDLDTASGTVTERSILVASDGSVLDNFGSSVSVSGPTAVVGAGFHDGVAENAGAAYVYRNVDTRTSVTGFLTQDVKLIASDAAMNDGLGRSVSISGLNAVAGAENNATNGVGGGSVYVYKNLDTATGTITEDVKLIASDADSGDQFGTSAAISGTTVVVGASRDDDRGANAGAVYVFLDAPLKSGTVTEDLKITVANGQMNDFFGESVALDNGRIAAAATGADGVVGDAGKVYSTALNTLTTLNEGGALRSITGLHVESRTDWVIGQTTIGNEMLVEVGSTMKVQSAGKAIFIGKNTGSDFNILVVEGTVEAGEIYVGNGTNRGNELVVIPGGTLIVDKLIVGDGSNAQVDLTISAGGSVGGAGSIDGDLTLDAGGQFEFQPGGSLLVSGTVSLDSTFGVDDILGLDSSVANGVYTLIDSTTNFSALGLENWGEENAYDLGGGKRAYLSEGSLQVTVIPELSSVLLALVCLVPGVGIFLLRR